MSRLIPSSKSRFVRFLAIPAVLAVVLAFLLWWPMPVPPLPPGGGSPGFEGAAESPILDPIPPPSGVNPVCAGTVLSHGKRTPTCFLLLHGLSNCPAQFAQLGALLHARGHNVIIPRLPDHGLLDRLTPDYGRMTLPGLANWAVDTTRLASAMGDDVVVVGLSVSGTTAAWLAMDHPGIARAVILAPFLGPAGMPPAANAPLGRLLVRLPDMFVWWDSELRENIPGPPYAYPGFPTRLVGRFMVLGSALVTQAARKPPACRDITFIISEADVAISLPLARQFAGHLASHPGVAVRQIWFPAAEHVPHDFLDPNQPDQQTARINPLLVQWLEEGARGSR